MRKIILSTQVTLDGYNDHTAAIVDEESWEYVWDLLENSDTLLFGSVTYALFRNYWPTVKDNPESSKNDVAFSNWIDNASKIVFSKTLHSVDWKNTTLIKDNIREEMLKLKQRDGKNMVILGGPSIIKTFMHLDLIDEYRFLMQPVVLGRGKSLFSGDGKFYESGRYPLKLIKTKPFSSGVVLFWYEPDKKL